MTAVFIHIPKTGGLSIREALSITEYCNYARLQREYSGFITFCHWFLPELQERGLAPKDAFTFAFCRNPYDRAVSMWAFNNRENGLDLTFPEFCRGLNDWRWGWRIRRPQAEWLDGVDLDFLGSFENLEQDFGILCDMLEVERRPLPVVNATERGPWQDYYDAETQGIIRAYYAQDFERLGY